MARREDPEFAWCPEGHEHAARAGHIIAASIKAFLSAAGLPPNSCFTAIVVPDGLDEAGQQTLLDNLESIGFDSKSIHLLPRPLAVAMHWCQTTHPPQVPPAQTGGEAKTLGRLRVATMSLDAWEALSLELHAFWQGGRQWLVPVRDRTRLSDAMPELPTPGISLALALARADTTNLPGYWWHRLFASDWLSQRLAAQRDLSQQEIQALQAVRSSTVSNSWQVELDQFRSLQPLWTRVFHSGPPLREAIAQKWETQERHLGTSALPCSAVLVDGALASLRGQNSAPFGLVFTPPSPGVTTHVAPSSAPAAVLGAALAAAAIAHQLPSYRETLLPLDLYVLDKDEFDDPAPKWKELVAARTVEAGRTWRSPAPVAGLQIRESQDQLRLPLRRALRGNSMFREVATELSKPAKQDEPVRISVEVRPGQGFARVTIDSVTPGVFSTRIDWRTMQESPPPMAEKLSYLHGVSSVISDRQLFRDAEFFIQAALLALERNDPDSDDHLRDLTNRLNKWPLAHVVEGNRGHFVPKDFMRHYGVLNSDGNVNNLPSPGVVRALGTAIGSKFSDLIRHGRVKSRLGNALLRTAGWLYLAMPDQCRDFLRSRVSTAAGHKVTLTAVELNGIGLAFREADPLDQFFLLVVATLRNQQARPNNWLRAVRNICRFRNHALKPDIISERNLLQLVELLYDKMKEQAQARNFQRIFGNCLETVPYLLKRRRYEPHFLTPKSPLATRLIRFLQAVDQDHQAQLPSRLKKVPEATINFLKMEATESDIEKLLGVEDTDEDDD
ncbi:MAG TPA: hypothetical protein PKI20_00460 [Verrucomicrobiota bacterium]|nr:hypothetical protein [Verrucomicrobiota bacterium]